MKVLLLGGTAEARALSFAIAQAGYGLTSSLAGATRRPTPYAGSLRTGGFGGAGALTAWLKSNQIACVIDATHPFAEQMSANAAEASAAAGCSLLQLARPPWPTRPNWQVAPNLQAAAQAIPQGARVLLATGHRSAPAFAARGDICAIVRVIEPQAAPCPIPGGQWHISPPPHSRADETRLFRARRIDTLVARNSGGATGTEKLDAAQELGLTTIVVAPPALPPADRAGTIDEAMAWLATQA